MTNLGFRAGPQGRPRRPGQDTPVADGDDLFEMANLYPKTTGLPMTVWVSPRGNAQHDARVKVSHVAGNRMVIEDAAVVSIRPQPALLEGSLSPADLAAVTAWINLNREVLLEYWDGVADTADLIQRLQRV